jgi:putative Holliday junction resolvase
VAISTADQTIASPLETYPRRGDTADARHLIELADEYRVVGLVVGLPVHMSGDEGELARQAREFGRWVAGVTHRPVCFWDERYTSALAEDLLQQSNLSKKKRDARIDKLAAQIMLQSFLESRRETWQS